jgi:Fe-S-cluster-containing hydrogenase component 2
MITVSPEKCPQDHVCPMIRLCKSGAISQEGVGLPNVDPVKCTGCLVCVYKCPRGAFEKHDEK